MTDDVMARVRALRAGGSSPKAIARALGVPSAEAARLVRAVAAQDEVGAPEAPVAACWISPGWSLGLAVDGHPEWADVDEPDEETAGLASVLLARQERRYGKLRYCGYMVDTYCLGVKNALGPESIDERGLAEFAAEYFASYDEDPLAVPVELARQLVFGAVDYARGLGFEPHPDFAAAADILGPWTGPSAITFGRDGKPFYNQGPYDDTATIMRTLDRTAGKGNYHFYIAV
jgi:hypothetical protein